MRSRPRGLSLLEALVTLFLVGLVIVLSSGLISGMSRMNRRAQEGESSVLGLTALETMRREVLEAVTITSPNDPTLVDQLVFTKIDPNATNRLPSAPAVWVANKPTHRLAVRYFLDSDRLVRVATLATGESSQSVVAQNVEAFSTGLPRPEIVELKISFSRGQTIVSGGTLARRYLP